MRLFPERKIFSVFELTAEIKQTLEDHYREIWVRGEISNFKHHSSGHMYFTLKDNRAQIKAACFRNNNRYLKFRPDVGMEVVSRGRISLYEPRGDYQMIVEYMEPVGVGSLQLAYEQLREKLRKEGLFDEAHKVALPALPRKIGIVTSPTGAAIRDMLQILARRNASLHVLLYPVNVQGSGSGHEIASALRYFNSRPDIDVVIVGRGGGSMEDLWAFNEEVVARAIYDSSIPVISAVGHEVDFTIADFVADLRVPTPSAAAEVVSKARDDLRTTVKSLEERAVQATRLVIERRRSWLERLFRHRAFEVAPNKIRELQQSFDEATIRMTHGLKKFTERIAYNLTILQTRLVKTDLNQITLRKREVLIGNQRLLSAEIRSKLHRERSRLEVTIGRMNALSPLSILGRGYALCRDASGSIMKNTDSTSPGDHVQVRLSRGALECQVERIRAESSERKMP